MSGIFGGVLELVNAVGFVALALMIGIKAAQRKTSRARWSRVSIGSLVLGLIMAGAGSLMTIAYIGEDNLAGDHINGIYAGFFFITPIVMFGVSMLLESLKRHIEDD